MILVCFIFILLFTTLENYFREQERFNPQKNSGAIWHISQLITLIITFVYMIVDKYGFNMESYSTLFLMGSIWFISFDGGLNLLRGFNFFKQSGQSTDPFRKYGTPTIKIILFSISLLLFIYFKLK